MAQVRRRAVVQLGIARRRGEQRVEGGRERRGLRVCGVLPIGEQAAIERPERLAEPVQTPAMEGDALHPDARCQHPIEALATGERLARWLLAPVGPAMSEEEVRHAVLGIVKAADYLGVRWYSDPQRAAWYATLLDERYGPGHDAYRPAFALEPGHLAAPRPAVTASPAPRPDEGATCGLAIPLLERQCIHLQPRA